VPSLQGRTEREGGQTAFLQDIGWKDLSKSDSGGWEKVVTRRGSQTASAPETPGTQKLLGQRGREGEGNQHRVQQHRPCGEGREPTIEKRARGTLCSAKPLKGRETRRGHAVGASYLASRSAETSVKVCGHLLISEGKKTVGRERGHAQFREKQGI